LVLVIKKKMADQYIQRSDWIIVEYKYENRVTVRQSQFFFLKAE